MSSSPLLPSSLFGYVSERESWSAGYNVSGICAICSKYPSDPHRNDYSLVPNGGAMGGRIDP